MKKLFVASLLLIASSSTLAGTWEYNSSESDMGDVSYSAVLESQETKNQKKGSIDVTLRNGNTTYTYITITQDVGLCFDDCLMEFRIDDVRIPTIDFKQLYNYPVFEITDKGLANQLLSSKNTKFKITNVRRAISSDVYTFNADEKFDLQRLKNLSISSN